MRASVFVLPFWGHLSTTLAIADQLRGRGHESIFHFVFPPDGWIAEEIEAHGHECSWSLRNVRSALGKPRWADQFRDVVAAEVEAIRATAPDVVVNDVRYTTPIAARVCGVPVVSVVRCVFPRSALAPERDPFDRTGDFDTRQRLMWGDVQLVPHGETWFRIPTPRPVHCRPCWVDRASIEPAALEPRDVLAVLSTAMSFDGRDALHEALSAWPSDHWVCDPQAAPGQTRANVVRWADLDTLLGGARVLVGLGGYQLITRALVHGVPVVVLETEDPHPARYGAALEAAGAGILIRRHELGARTIATAIGRLLDDPDAHAAAERLGRSFEEAPDAATALLGAIETAPARSTADISAS